MVRSISAIILFAFTAQALVQQLTKNRITEAQVSTNQLIDKLVDSVWDWTLNEWALVNADHDDMVLRKSGHQSFRVQTRLATPCARRVSPIMPCRLPFHDNLIHNSRSYSSNFLVQAYANEKLGQPAKPWQKSKPQEREQARKPFPLKCSEVQLQSVYLSAADVWSVACLWADEYQSKSSSLAKLAATFDYFTLVFPKTLAPFAMGHDLLGVKDQSTGELLAFADVSLQPDDGALDGLIGNMNLKQRQRRFKSLSPYLCNFLVVPKARRQGLGTRLVKECENRALELGYDTIHLHCEAVKSPALKLYANMGFRPVKKITTGSGAYEKLRLLFMKKKIEPNASPGIFDRIYCKTLVETYLNGFK
eukprot:gnl/MRDRNA2_/MRDRNA2_57742_c0_seq1.p1 gnl/MRDRNA2_/MRDRNA2_57742_c0~~gnl/MRDRNA2_/MRDRNA2_57742_c0_seq1.p1  ORF type:complete len:363 (-),score=57.31 gnl/MRDRNA2_/MRDRNA2_57742_c0_seq1:7-1095(-)